MRGLDKLFVMLMLGGFLALSAYYVLPGFLGRVSKVSRTPVCKATGKTEENFVNLRENPAVGQKTLVFTYAKCMEPGMVIPVKALNLTFLANKPQWWEKTTNESLVVSIAAAEPGEVEVVNIFSLTASDLQKPDAELAKKLAASSVEFITSMKSTIEKSRIPIPALVAQVRVTKRPILLRSRQSPRFLSQENVPVYYNLLKDAPPMTPRYKDIVASGGVIVDVRSPEEFARGHDPVAINIPYVEKEPSDQAQELSFLPRIAEDRFEVALLPKDKNAVVVFTANGLHDARASKAQLMAKLFGWRRVTVLWGGEKARLGQAEWTPEKPPYIISVQSRALSPQVQAGTVQLVDVRSPREYALRSIVGAKNFEFKIESEVSDSDLSTYDEEGRKLSQLFPDKKKALVVFGADSADWRSLNLVRVALRAGYTQVQWMREGLSGWLGLEADAPDRYRTFQPGNANNGSLKI